MTFLGRQWIQQCSLLRSNLPAASRHRRAPSISAALYKSNLADRASGASFALSPRKRKILLRNNDDKSVVICVGLQTDTERTSVVKLLVFIAQRTVRRVNGNEYGRAEKRTRAR